MPIRVLALEDAKIERVARLFHTPGVTVTMREGQGTIGIPTVTLTYAVRVTVSCGVLEVLTAPDTSMLGVSRDVVC